jgi:hypothetical protein
MVLLQSRFFQLGSEKAFFTGGEQFIGSRQGFSSKENKDL